jgi:lipid-binding SYLF domain-containing protein
MKTITGLGIIVLILTLLGCGGAKVGPTGEPAIQQVLVDQARIAVESFAADPDLDWPWFGRYFKYAKGVLVVPNLYKGAWFLGGSGGRGVLVVRDKDAGEWSGPAFYTMGSVSLGLQFGGQKSEVLILVMTRKGLDSLYSTSFKIGGELSFAVGPYGGGGQGATAPSLNVDYIAYARSMGAFVGLSLDGAVIKENYNWNKAYYGMPVRPVDILVTNKAVNPNSAKLRAAVAKASLTVR